jgi:hypothetical protein
MGVTHITGTFDETAGQAGIEYEQGPGCHNYADEEDAPPHAISNDPFTSRTGRLVHQAGIRRIDAKRERGRAIGHQVDPQDLRR